MSHEAEIVDRLRVYARLHRARSRATPGTPEHDKLTAQTAHAHDMLLALADDVAIPADRRREVAAMDNEGAGIHRI